MNALENFEEVLIAFSSHKVNYMLVGGFAVNHHGYNRSTSDLDIWVKSGDENKIKVYNALVSMGYPKQDLAPILAIDFNKPFMFNLGEQPDDVEIFNSVTGLVYEEAEKNKVNFTFEGGLVVNFIHLRDLIVNKMLTGRLKDKLDVEELQRINALKKGNDNNTS